MEADMARTSGTGNGSFIAGLILGTIGGAVGGLFVAPKPGEELRHDIEVKISETTSPVRQKAGPLVTEGNERATGFVDKAADRAQELSGKIAAIEIPIDDDRVDHAPGPNAPSAGIDPKAPAS
jgi:gas vesicle protein